MVATMRWTVADLEALPDDGRLYEIIDGELYMSRNPTPNHQVSCFRLSAMLDEWSRVSNKGRVFTFTALLFANDDYAVPDAFWVSNERLALIYDRKERKFLAAPELVIEVLSPGSANETRDRDAKLKLYSRRGVSEYWIVNWWARQIEVYRRENAQLHLVATLFEADTLTSSLLGGFSCLVASIFEDLLPVE